MAMSTLVALVTQKDLEIEAMKKQFECQICMVRQVDTVFKNCGHLACHFCAQQILNSSRMCYSRCNVEFKIGRIYLA